MNNRLAGHLQKCSFFSDFEYDFKSSQLTAYFLTVACDRIAKALINRSGASRTAELDIPIPF